MKKVKAYLAEVVEAAEAVDLGRVCAAIDLLQAAYEEDRAVYIIGNGGSAANAMHFAQDLAKGAMPDLEGKRLRVLSLVDNISYITALSNDMGYERIFELQLRPFAQAGDVLVAISGSGNSANVIRAVEYARGQGLTVISVTGFDGGRLGALADVHIHVPIDDMCKTEAVHGILFHMISDVLKLRLS